MSSEQKFVLASEMKTYSDVVHMRRVRPVFVGG
jgi:hypothetical protein